MTIPDLTELKRQLRQRMRAISVDSVRHQPAILAAVTRWLEQHPELRRLAIYHPLAGEPDLLGLISVLPGRIWHFPRIAGGEMSFHPVSCLETELFPGTHGIREPSPSIPEADPEDIDAFLCPGLAFEHLGGGRLGRGKGYYDRYLARARKSAVKTGVTFPERLVDDVFAEAHDIRMDLVIS